MGAENLEEEPELVFLQSPGNEFPPRMPEPPVTINTVPASESFQPMMRPMPKATPMPKISVGHMRQRLSKLFPGRTLPLDFRHDGPPHARVFTYFLEMPLPGGSVQAQ